MIRLASMALAICVLGLALVSGGAVAGGGEDRRGPWCPTHRLPGEKVGDRFDASRLIGKTTRKAHRLARRHDCSVRVVKLNGQPLIVTQDFSPSRINVAVRDHRIKNIMGVG